MTIASPKTEGGPTVDQHTSPIMRHFNSGHLAEGPLKEVFEQYAHFAEALDASLPGGPEKTTALRKLLESKDCAMRATVESLTASA